MSKAWPLVKLGEVISQRKEFITIDDTQEYMRCRVQLHAKGIVLRDRVTGSEIKTKQQQVCRAGELLVAEIDAKVGGFGIVPDELEESIVSSHYFLFTIDSAKLNKKFLDFYSKTPTFREQVNAKGSTNYAAIRPQEVLNYTIPLPPFAEQQRIVARIERLAGKIEEAKRIKETTSKQVIQLFEGSRSKLIKKAFKSGKIDLTSVANLERGKFSYRPRNDPRFFGGDHPWIQISEIESSKKYIQNWTQTLNDDGLAISRKFGKGTLLISIAATIGAVGILDFDRCVPDSIVAVIPRISVDTEFLYHYLGFLRTHLEEIAPQSAQKNINLNILSQLPFPNIPIHKQRHIVTHLDNLQARLDKIEATQAQTTVELDAMLPSILDKAFKGEF